MKRLSRIWHLAGNIYLTMGIIGMMAADLVWGYTKLKDNLPLFAPINDRGFLAWAATWGSESLSVTLWLFILVGLMALLSVNTFVCTTNRVITLVRFRHRFKSPWRFFLKFGPHVMHYAMLIMFLGYLVSYLYAGTHLGKVLLPGKSITVDQVSMTLKDIDIDYYDGERMPHFQRRAIRVTGTLLFSDGNHKKVQRLSYNRPALFKGYSVHLRGFGPKTKSGMNTGRSYITITVKKDPGMKFYFAGMVFFTLGLFMYTGEKIHTKKPVKPAPERVSPLRGGPREVQ